MPKPREALATPTPVRRSVSLLDTIRVSDQYAAFEADYDRINRGVNIKKSVNRLLQLHGTRRIRSLSTSELLSNAQYELIEAHRQNQAYRSDATEIRLSLFMAHAALSELNDGFWKWLSTAYVQELLALGHKSVDSKWNFTALIIDYSVSRLSRLASAISVADQIIKDLDQCYWALKSIQDAVTTIAQEKYHG